MSKSLIIGIADLNIASSSDVLITYALGSCIGICLYDHFKKIAGMAHIMLPYSTEYKYNDNINIMKYADTAAPELIKRMEKLGASRARMVAKIAGGAQMFALKEKLDSLNIGKRNIIATKEILKDLNIKLIAEDVGLDYGRTVEFSAETGILKIKTIANGIKEI